MLKTIMNRFALSEKGAKQFLKGVLFSTLLNFALMLPAVFLFLFLEDYLKALLAVGASPVHGVLYYILMGLGFMVLTYIVATLQYKSTYTTIYEESAARRIGLAEKLRILPLAFFASKNLSDLTSTIMNDNTDLEQTFSHAVPQLFASLCSIALVAISLFVYDWRLALPLFWVVPVAGLFILGSKAFANRHNTAVYLQKREVSERIQEGMDTIQEIKAYGIEEQYLASFNDTLSQYEKKLIRLELIGSVFFFGAQSLLKLGMVSVILVGAYLIAAQSLPLFTFLVFLLIASRVYDPINEVLMYMVMLYYLDLRINRLKEMAALPIQQGKTTFAPTSFDLEFRGVRFAYEENKSVLNEVSFTAKQGEITALVGPSGGGKSTVAKLSARFWDVDGGQVLLGGEDIQEIDPETLLQHYSVVFQEVVLFNSSVMENIRVGRRDATDEEVLQAARVAQCDDFVLQLPQGYETIIGENGATLSGGERQRISIARALLKDAPIVLLDEATASLDVENETKIQSALSRLVKEKTVLIVAHRMRTIANADKIVVLEKGRVVEQGTPEELKAQKGAFSKMLHRQLGVRVGV